MKLSFLVIQPNAPLTHRVATGDSIAVQGRKSFRNLLYRKQQTEGALFLSHGLFARSPLLLRCRHFDLQERGKRRRTTEQIKFRPSSDRQTRPSSPREEGETGGRDRTVHRYTIPRGGGERAGKHPNVNSVASYLDYLMQVMYLSTKIYRSRVSFAGGNRRRSTGISGGKQNP